MVKTTQIITIFIFLLVIWTVLVIFSKQEAKSILDKYGKSLPWIKSNSIIVMISKLRELKEQKILNDDDVGECDFLITILKGTFLVFPFFFILMILISKIL